MFDGGLSVSGTNANADLDKLRCVEIVRGNLTVSNVDSLEPLSALVQVLGDLTITKNDKLETLHGLEALTWVEGSLELSQDSSLHDLRALKSLVEVSGSLSLSSIPVTSLHGLEGLTKVGGDLSLSILPELDTLALPGLTSIGGDLSLTFLGKLADGPHLSTTIGGNFTLEWLDKLTSFKPSRWWLIRGNVSIRDNKHLQTLSMPNTLGQVGISSNPALRTITSLQGAGQLQPKDFPLLQPSVDVEVTHNDALESISLTGFGESTYVSIENNRNLSKITSDEFFVSPPFSLSLQDLPKLKVVGFGDTAEFYDLTISNTGLEELKLNRFFASFCSFSVTGNPQLVKIDNLQYMHGAFVVDDNPKLNDCSAQALALQLNASADQTACVQPGRSPFDVGQSPLIEVKGNDNAQHCAGTSP